jgi:hypothetical protein
MVAQDAVGSPRRREQLGTETPSDLERYRAYRRRQAELLPTLIPREGLRPLYRAAREWALDRGISWGKDPLVLLHRYCDEVLLPLPPFDEWLAGQDRWGSDPAAPESAAQGSRPLAEPVLLSVQRFAHGERDWTAGLTVLRRPGGWSGHIAFSDGEGLVARSAEIFLEEDLGELRSRFDSFEPNTLSAFLRSALP